MDRLQIFEDCMLKRVLLNPPPLAFTTRYFLANDHSEMRVIKGFLGVPNLRRGSTPFYIFCAFLTWHKSFNFGASFCCWGEVVVPSEPPKKRKNQENSEILNHGGENWTRTQRFLKSVLRAHHFIANVWSKSSVVCLFFLLCFSSYGNFFAPSYSLFISPL